MEDWGLVVEVGQDPEVVIPEGKFLYLSVATLLEPKQKVKKPPPVYTFSAHQNDKEKRTLVCLNLKNRSTSIGVVYSKSFSLSHSSSDGPVSFSGYMAYDPTYYPHPEAMTKSHDYSLKDKKRDLASTSGTAAAHMKNEWDTIDNFHGLSADGKKNICFICRRTFNALISVRLHVQHGHDKLKCT